MENTEMEMKEEIVDNAQIPQKKGIDDVREQLEEMQLKLGSGNAPRKISDPLKEFFIVELTMKGSQRQVRNIDDRVMQAVSMLDRDQRSRFGKMKVQFYRQLQALSSFKVQDKYVISQKNMPVLDSFFRSLESEFESARKEVFDYLKANWTNIMKDIKAKHPTLNIDDATLASLEPEDLKFLEMDYSTRTLSKMLSEMGDLKEIFSQGAASDPDIARRIESQKDALVAQLKGEYEGKLAKLEETIKKLTTVGKGKRYVKVVDQVGKMLEDVDSMQEIVGEDVGLADRLEEMKLKLSSVNTGK
jgi:hypothetical protein